MGGGSAPAAFEVGFLTVPHTDDLAVHREQEKIREERAEELDDQRDNDGYALVLVVECVELLLRVARLPHQSGNDKKTAEERADVEHHEQEVHGGELEQHGVADGNHERVFQHPADGGNRGIGLGGRGRVGDHGIGSNHGRRPFIHLLFFVLAACFAVK